MQLPYRLYSVIDSVEGRTFDEKLRAYVRYHSDVMPNVMEYIEKLGNEVDRKKADLKRLDDYYRQYRDFMYRLSKIDVYLGSMVQDVERLLSVELG